MLMDTSNSLDIIFKSALNQLLIESKKITPRNMPLIGFTGDVFILKGIITLLISIGEVPIRFIHMIDFLIMDHLSACNIIMGKPFLTKIKAMVSMHYLAMKILTTKDIITINKDQ